MSVCYQLVRLLADGKFHSGEAIGKALGITRAGVWKQVRTLDALGLVYHAVRGKGYRLAQPLELLDVDRVVKVMGKRAQSSIHHIETFHELASTNDRLRKLGAAGAVSGTVCLAERQTGGRGRYGREWVSPFGANIYLSLLWRFESGATALGGLSLAIGIALVRALHELGVDGIGLKWPNDVYHHDAKLAGILIELAGEPSGPCQVVIGVGVNVRMPAADGIAIDQRWTDLHAITGDSVSRNDLTGKLLEQLILVVKEFETAGLRPFLDEWHRYDVAFNRTVRVHAGNNFIEGKAKGIDGEGALILETAEGTRRFASGEVSLRITE